MRGIRSLKLFSNKQMNHKPVADLGGGGGGPFWNLKKKKKKKIHINVSELLNVSDYPPPPLRDFRRWWRSEKKVSESPPPPPRSSAFLGLAQLSMLATVRKVCSAPPPLF